VARAVRELSPERARKIGEAARKRVLADHTYERRGALVQSILEETLRTFSSEAMEMRV
jgi:spore maturation protein CgeB